MYKLIGATFLTAVFIVSALPAQATIGLNQPVVAMVDSTGAIKIGYASEFNTDSFQTCTGDAPLVNSCTLHGYTSPTRPSWIFGWQAPGSFQGTPVGTVELSTYATLSGSNGNTAKFECTWLVNPSGFIIPGEGVRCRLIQFQLAGGSLTYTTHAGLYDPSALGPLPLPSTNDVEAGVGNWVGLLGAF